MISPEIHKCVKCKKNYNVDEPFEESGYIGFKMKEHGCGEEYRYTISICIDEEKNKEWDNILKGLKDE